MEKAEEKLKVLMEKAKQQNFDLSSLKSIKKRKQHFAIPFKLKSLTALLILSCFYGSFSHLFDSQKVRSFSSTTFN